MTIFFAIHRPQSMGLLRERRTLLALALVRATECGFFVITIQRTGSTWLAEALDRHPCVQSGLEMFLNEKVGVDPFTWSDAQKLRGLEAMFTDDGPNVTVGVNSTRRFHSFLTRCRRASAGKHPGTSCGFKWMLSQHVDRVWDTWLPEFCARRGVRLVFLERLNLLRIHASTVGKNMDDRNHNGGRNPTSEAPRRAYLELATGPVLLGRLEEYERNHVFMRHMRKKAKRYGIATLSVTYEQLQADRGLGLDAIASFVLGGSKATCDTHNFTFVDANASTHAAQVHPEKLSTYVLNWDEVAATLNGTRFACYLDEDNVTRLEACRRAASPAEE